MKVSLKSRHIWFLLASLIPFGFYSLTLCPTVYCGDSGELALAAANLEIAHPPGYPLLTNLGHVWTSILFFLRPIVALNILAALFAAAAGVFVFLILMSFLKPDSAVTRLIAAAVSVAFTLSRTLWSAATSFEVYALATTLAAVVILLLAGYHCSGRKAYWYLACYLFGLALCNHLSVLSLAPALILLAVYHRRELGLRTHAVTFVLILLPLTFYLYLNLRSTHSLMLDWYNPETIGGLKQHIFAQTYQRYVATLRWGDILPYLLTIWRVFSHEYVLPLLFLALPGIYCQYRRDRRLAAVSGLIVVTNWALNFNYLIPDIDSYFLPSIIVFAVWIGELLVAVSRKARVWSYAAAAAALIVAAVAAGGNYRLSDISSRKVAEEYGKDLFEYVPYGGVLFCGSDNSMFPALYLHYAEGYRFDCKVYGHLPTLARLRDDLGLETTPGYNSFPNLLKYAAQHSGWNMVFAREPMQIVNDFKTLIPTLYPRGLAYYPDSTAEITPTRSHFDWRRVPEIDDWKEAVTYVTYFLINGEELVRAGDPLGERYLTTALDLVRPHRNFALFNELGGYFVASGELRLARKTLEQGLALPELRFGQRLRLLSSLGTVCLESGDVNSARDIFERMLKMDASNDVARFHLMAMEAEVAVKEKRFEVAIANYRRMQEIFPGQREVTYQLGSLSLQVGDSATARRMFDVCLKENYRSEEIRKLLSGESRK